MDGLDVAAHSLDKVHSGHRVLGNTMIWPGSELEVSHQTMSLFVLHKKTKFHSWLQWVKGDEWPELELGALELELGIGPGRESLHCMFLVVEY